MEVIYKILMNLSTNTNYLNIIDDAIFACVFVFFNKTAVWNLC